MDLSTLEENLQKALSQRKDTQDFVSRTLFWTWGKDESCLKLQVLAHISLQEVQTQLNLSKQSSLYQLSLQETVQDLRDGARVAILQEEQDLSSRNLDQFLEELEAPFDLPVPRFSQDQVQFLLKEGSFPILVDLLKEVQADFLNQKTSNLFYRFVDEPLFTLLPMSRKMILIRLQLQWLDQIVPVAWLLNQPTLCLCEFERDLSALRFMQQCYNLEI